MFYPISDRQASVSPFRLRLVNMTDCRHITFDPLEKPTLSVLAAVDAYAILIIILKKPVILI